MRNVYRARADKPTTNQKLLCSRTTSYRTRNCKESQKNVANYLCLLLFLAESFIFSPAVLDLSDEDGELRNLPEFPTHYAHRFLKGREVFVLIKIESKFKNSNLSRARTLNSNCFEFKCFDKTIEFMFAGIDIFRVILTRTAGEALRRT